MVILSGASIKRKKEGKSDTVKKGQHGQEGGRKVGE